MSHIVLPHVRAVHSVWNRGCTLNHVPSQSAQSSSERIFHDLVNAIGDISTDNLAFWLNSRYEDIEYLRGISACAPPC